MRSDIADFGLADALPAPHAATLALAMLSTRLARLDGDVQERVINWGYAACDAGLRAHVDAGAARARRLPVSRGRGRQREARAPAARAVGLRPGPAPALHAGLAGHARRLDGVRRASPTSASTCCSSRTARRARPRSRSRCSSTPLTAERPEMQLAYNQSHVAAELTFEELVRGVLPLSRWWRDYLWPRGTDDVGHACSTSAGARSSPGSRTRCASRAGARSATSCPGALIWFVGHRRADRVGAAPQPRRREASPTRSRRPASPTS